MKFIQTTVGSIFAVTLFLVFTGNPATATTWDELLTEYPLSSSKSVLNTEEILNRSQISYRAVGKDTPVQSFGVIISCVKGKISLLKSLTDPSLDSHGRPLRHIGTLEIAEYLKLWDSLQNEGILSMKNAHESIQDSPGNYTLQFTASIGDQKNQFSIDGPNKFESPQHFAIQAMIDKVAQMHELWNTHSSLVKVLHK